MANNLNMKQFHLSPPVIAALLAAILFGSSTPFAKQLIGDTSPLLLAGLLYMGSGIGLTFLRVLRDKGWSSSGLLVGDWLWYLGVISFGGIIAPALLMIGLVNIGAASASLLLNFEAVMTAMLAWIVFKENADRRIIFGMLLIVSGGVILSWPNASATSGNLLGAFAIIAACLCWAIDNNLSKKISGADPLFIAGMKGIVAGTVNISLALLIRFEIPEWHIVGLVLSLGFICYGISLVCFLLALRGLGTARTGAYFSTAPFIGVAIAIIFFHESTTLLFWISALLMGAGVWIHLTEWHEHEHTHEFQHHDHQHTHDLHHQHTHLFPWENKDSHSHPHDHQPTSHSHHHYPDNDHTHKHK